MADADVPITAGAGTKIDTRTVGAGTDEHRQVMVIGDPSTASAVQAVDDTLKASLVAGASYANATGTITTATSVVTSGDVSRAGNITVAVYGTYAGVNVAFEASPDGGTTWFAWAVTREDAGISEATSGVLPANTSRAWTVSAPGFNRFRVRATAFTSGTANVIIAAGTLPIEPMVSAVVTPPPRTSVFFGWRDVTGTAGSESALTNWTVGTRGGSAVTAASSWSVPAGKTLRIQALSYYVRATSTVNNFCNLNLRAAGTVSNSSPHIWATSMALELATVAAVAMKHITVSFPDGGLEVVGAQQVAFTWLTGATTCALGLFVNGYEY